MLNSPGVFHDLCGSIDNPGVQFFWFIVKPHESCVNLEGRYMHADWKKNGEVGDEVINPPQTLFCQVKKKWTTGEIQARLGGEGRRWHRGGSCAFCQGLGPVMNGALQARWGVSTQTHKYVSLGMSRGMVLSKVAFGMTYMSGIMLPPSLGHRVWGC